MRIQFLGWLRSWFAVRGLASSDGRAVPVRTLDSAEEQALFFDVKALSQAKQRLGDDGRHWGRLLASLVLACALLMSAPDAAHACDASDCSAEEDVSLIDVVLDLVLNLFSNGEGGSTDPSSGSGQ